MRCRMKFIIYFTFIFCINLYTIYAQNSESSTPVEIIRIGPDTPASGVISNSKTEKSWDVIDELHVDELTGVQQNAPLENQVLKESKSRQIAYKIDDTFRQMLTQCVSGNKTMCAQALAFADKNSIQCNLNSTEVCRAYAKIYLFHNQRQKALNARQIACNGDNATACFEAWKLYESGKGIKKNPKQGFMLLTRSCEFKNAEACYQLAGYYRTGVGAELNLKKAKDLYSKSCDLGNSDACDAYNEFL